MKHADEIGRALGRAPAGVGLRPVLAAAAVLVLLAHAAVARGQEVADGRLEDTPWIGGLSQPSALAFLPDGRLLIADKGAGRIRVVQHGGLLPAPMVDLRQFAPITGTYDSFGERGVSAMIADPDFVRNGLLYVFYSVCTIPGTPSCLLAHNRFARFRVDGDVVDPQSFRLIFELPADSGIHHGGWMGFGPIDGLLYLSVGDGGVTPDKAQDLSSPNGKILRLTPEGAIPPDNPFVGRPGARGEIWALGLRNPFRCSFAANGRLFCGDVGEGLWEEINAVEPGRNYGWPLTEGPFPPSMFPQFTQPFYPYSRIGVSAAVIAGPFGSATGFSEPFRSSFFFGDYGLGVIQRLVLDSAAGVVLGVEPVVTNLGIGSITDFAVGPDGAIYYTHIARGEVRRLAEIGTNRSPVARITASATQGLPPLVVEFSSEGSSDPDGDALSFEWDFGDGSPSATEPTVVHTFEREGVFTVTLTVRDDGVPVRVGIATARVTVGTPPVVTIHAPTDGARFRAGDTVPLLGSAVDAEDGELPLSALRWQVVFFHSDHTHPFLDDLPGTTDSFVTATTGETSADVGYEVVLRATDSSGITARASVRIVPETALLILATVPRGLPLLLDGQPRVTPTVVSGVVGFRRTLTAPTSQEVGEQPFDFAGWSDGVEGATRTIITPAETTDYVAIYTGRCRSDRLRIVPPGGGEVRARTSGASAADGSCAPGLPAPEVAFAWTPERSGVATFDTCSPGSGFRTVVYVREELCAPASELACVAGSADCDGRAAVRMPVAAGRTYFVFVDGSDGAAGEFVLSIVPPAAEATEPPAPEECGASVSPNVGVRCGVTRVRERLVSLSACGRACRRVVERRLRRIERTVAKVESAAPRMRCRLAARQAYRAARAFERRLGRVLRRSDVAADQLEALVLEGARLRAGVLGLRAQLCEAPRG